MSCEPSSGSRCTSSRMPSSKAALTVSVTVVSEARCSLRPGGDGSLEAEAGSLRLRPLCCRHLPVPDHLLHQLHRLARHLLWLQLRVVGTVGNGSAGPPPVHKRVAQVREFDQRQGVGFKPSWRGHEHKSDITKLHVS